MMIELPVHSYNSIQLIWLMAAYANLNEKDLRLCLYFHEVACYSNKLVADQNLLVEGVFFVVLQRVKLSKKKWDKIVRFFGNSKKELMIFAKKLGDMAQFLHRSDIKSIKLHY